MMVDYLYGEKKAFFKYDSNSSKFTKLAGRKDQKGVKYRQLIIPVRLAGTVLLRNRGKL